MTELNTITERLAALFVENFYVEVPAADTDLLESGILDSLQFVELLFRLEQEFQLRIRIDDIDLADLRTLARIARLIAANRPTAGAAMASSLSGAVY